jgi:hypothetical protein
LQNFHVVCRTNALEHVRRCRQPQELVKIQSDFVSRQAQLVGDQTKEFGQKMAELNDVTKPTLDGAAEHARRRFKAA